MELSNNLTTPSPNALFIPTEADANVKSSVRAFVRWLDERGLHWTAVDLKDYLDYLTNETTLAKPSIKKHMERVRARYKDMQHSNAVRDMIQAQIPASADAANAYAITEEFLARLRNNTEYDKRLEVKLTTVASFVDSDFTWLNRDEIELIFTKCDRTKIGMRDAAMFGLCLSYGLREAEACAVTVADLRETQDGVAGVLVKHGKGDKRRFVRRDDLMDYTGYIEAYIDIFKAEGLILGGMTTRNLQKRVGIYTDAKPHDLRRTYAKLLHTGGRSTEYIKQNLGHVKVETTLGYIGLIRD